MENETIYADISDDNVIKGFYSSNIHSDIPNTAVEISPEIRKEILAKGKQFRIKDISVPITMETIEEITPSPSEPTPIEQLRADVDFLMIMEGYADV